MIKGLEEAIRATDLLQYRCCVFLSDSLQPPKSATQRSPSYSLAGLPRIGAHHVSQGTVLLEWSSLALVGDCHHRLGRQIAF